MPKSQSRSKSKSPAVLTESGLHAGWAAPAFLEAGFTLQSCPLVNMPARLASGQFNAVVFGRFYLPRKTKQEAEAFTKELLKAVKDFLAAGGGVFMATSSEQTAKTLYSSVEAEILPLQIEQSDALVTEKSEANAYSTAVEEPFNDGVSGFWFPMSKGSATAARPVRGNPSTGWHTIAATAESSRTKPLEQVGYGLPGDDIPGYDSCVPLIAGRDFSAGRVAVCGIPGGFHLFSPPNYPSARKFLVGGCDGKPSDFRRLLINIVRWLAEPSMASGKLGGAQTDPNVLQPQAPRYPDDPPVHWAARDFPPDIKPRIGLIGARTAYSGGKGTVADYVARAKAPDTTSSFFSKASPKSQRRTGKRFEPTAKPLPMINSLPCPGLPYATSSGARSSSTAMRSNSPSRICSPKTAQCSPVAQTAPAATTASNTFICRIWQAR